MSVTSSCAERTAVGGSDIIRRSIAPLGSQNFGGSLDTITIRVGNFPPVRGGSPCDEYPRRLADAL